MENKSYIQSAIYPNERTYFLKMVRFYGLDINHNPKLLKEAYIITQYNNDIVYFTSLLSTRTFYTDRFNHNYYYNKYNEALKDYGAFSDTTKFYQEGFLDFPSRYEITDMTTFDEVALPMMREMFGVKHNTLFTKTYYRVKMIDTLIDTSLSSDETKAEVDYMYSVLTEKDGAYPMTAARFETSTLKYELGLDENGEGIVMINEIIGGENEGVHRKLYLKMD